MEETHANDEAPSSSIHSVTQRKETQESEKAAAETVEVNDGLQDREKAEHEAAATEAKPAKQPNAKPKKIAWKEVQVDKPLTPSTSQTFLDDRVYSI